MQLPVRYCGNLYLSLKSATFTKHPETYGATQNIDHR